MWAAVGAAGGAWAQELMDPEQAFQVSTRMTGSNQLEVTWRIAEDHYMYRQAFSVTAVDGGAVLGEPEFPEGKKKRDEFFGEVETYEQGVVFTVPVTPASNDVEVFDVEAVGQGCNEPVGVCFPPVKKTTTVQLAAAGTQAPQSLMSGQSTDGGVLDTLKGLLDGGAGSSEFLHPDEAFRFEVTPMGGEALLVRFFIEPGYYLYKDKFGVKSETPSVAVTGVELPEGKKKTDEYFGEIEAFYNAVDAQVSLKRHDPNTGEASFQVSYQGCAEDGICYPPIEKQASVRLPGVSDAAAATAGTGTGPSAGPAAGGSRLWPVILAFGSGILLTFTPCVLPMIPILAGIIVGQGGGVTRMRGGALASIYVLGTAVTYAAIGVVAGLTGDQLQAYFQNAWAVGLVAVLLVLMAVSMFGFYELRMPSAIQSRLQHRAAGLKAGAFGGVFLMGAVSALIVGACVSPILISILGLAIQRGDPVLGAAIMFAMAMGMGLFLVAMGFGFGHVLPRTGAWMETVKHVFGVLLLAVAVYLLGAIPEVPVLYLWAALLIGTAVYLGARVTAGERAGWKVARQGAAAALIAWAVLAVLGGVQGNRDVFMPVNLRALSGAAPEQTAGVEFRRASNPEELSGLMQTAREQGKPVMVDYYADWCVDCVRMEKTTFAVPEVARVLERDFVLVQIDVTNPNDPGTRSIKQAHEVFGPPAMLFFDRQGNEVRSLRRYGYMSSGEFLRHIESLRQG